MGHEAEAGGGRAVVTVPAPPDSVLGAQAAALLDADMVGARLGELAEEEVVSRPRYARYKPRTSLLVQYDVVVGSAHGLAHAWLFGDDRAVRTWRSASFERLVDRARRRHPALPVRATFFEDLGALVEVTPVDSRLRPLVRAASAKKLARLLGDLAPLGLEDASVQTIRHKPGRKALLRFDTGDERLYVKVHSDGCSRQRFDVARAVAHAGIPTAEPVACVGALQAVAYAEAAGERLADLEPERYREWLGPLAEALAEFQRRAPLVTSTRLEERRLAAAGRAIDALLPSIGGAGGRLAAAIARRTSRYKRRDVLTHGDFYDDQLLVAPGRVVILDLDEARRGHPLADVGNFLAHLSLNSEDALRAAFIDACAAAGFDLRGVLAFEAAALLALAVRPFRRLEAGWPERVEEIVELAASRLRADRSPPAPVDDALPQLHVLADPVAAHAPLGRALERPVSVAAVDVVRHKVGRRCTLRYRLDDGRVLFAKTYASRRAGRVHESYCRLAAARELPVPRPVGWDEECRLVATEPLLGATIRERVMAGERALGDEIAELLYAFHTSAACLERRHALCDEIGPLAGRVDRLVDAAPALAPVARRCLLLAQAGSRRGWRWRWQPVHRDLYEDQLVSSNGRLGMLDLDDAAMSEPALDTANLLAHLRLRALRSSSGGPAAVARAFLSRYRTLDPELDPALVTFLTGTTLLRLSEIHLSRGGRPLAEALLARAEGALLLALRGVVAAEAARSS